MRLLALDTSTGPASAALLSAEGTCLARHEDAQPMRQSQRLVQDVDAMMRQHDGYEGIGAIAVTTGPGGFTGIRVALAAARGFALACDVPLLGISTLETLAWQALREQPVDTQVTPLVNAFRNQAYVQAFCRSTTGMHPLCEPQAVDIAALPEFLAVYPDAQRIGTLAENIAHVHHIKAYQHLLAPHARYAGEYALALLAENHAAALTSHPAEACYIRPPDAKPQTPLFPA